MPECLLCDSDPCTCVDRKRRRALPKAKPPAPSANPLAAPVLRVGTNTQLPSLVPPKIPEPQVAQELVVKEQTDEDAEWLATVRAIYPILSVEDKQQVDPLVSVPPTRKEKIVAWRRLFFWRKSHRAKAR